MSDHQLPAAPEAPQRPTFYDPSNTDANVQVSVADLFGKNFRGGVMEIDYMLCTKDMRSLYRRDFVYLSRLLHSLDSYRSISIADQSKLDEIEGRIAKKLDAVRQLITKQLRGINALLEANPAPAHNFTFPKAMRYRAPLVSPYAREFMELLCSADRVYTQLEIAFLFGLVDRKKRTDAQLTIRKAIRAISASTRQARIDTLTYVMALRTQAADGETLESINALTGQDAKNLAAEGKDDQEVLGSVSHEHAVQEAAAAAEARDTEVAAASATT